MTSNLQKISNEFDNNVKFLINVYVNKKKGTFDESETLLSKRRILLIMKTNPTYIIKTLGPYFLKYGDYIQRGRFEELLKMNFADETKKSKDEAYIKKTMEFIKNIYKSSSEEEKNKLNETFENMLSLYAEFVMLSKKKS